MAVTLIGNMIFVDIIKFICGPAGLGWALNPGTGVFIRKQCEDTEKHTRRMLGEDGGKVCNDASASQETLRIARNHWKLGEGHGANSSSEPSEGTKLADALILDFQTLELDFCCFKPPSWWYLVITALGY